MKTRFVASVAALLFGASLNVAWAQTTSIKFRFAHAHPTSDSQHIAALEFAKKVKERTQGGVEILIFPNNTLGNDNTMIAGVRGGTIDIEMSGNPYFTGIEPKLNVLDLPYLFDSMAQVTRVLDGPIGRGLLNELESKQLKGLAFWEIGFRSLANSRRPVVKAEDIKGLKLRTTPNQAHIKAFQLLGAAPQPMPFAEVYSALESKAIDGHENPPNVMVSTKMFEVQKYLSLTRHAYTASLVVMNKARFDALKPEFQQILLQEAVQAAVFQRVLNAKGETQALADLRANGMQIVDAPDTEGMKRIVAAETRKIFAEKNGDDLLKAIDALR